MLYGQWNQWAPLVPFSVTKFTCTIYTVQHSLWPYSKQRINDNACTVYSLYLKFKSIVGAFFLQVRNVSLAYISAPVLLTSWFCLKYLTVHRWELMNCKQDPKLKSIKLIRCIKVVSWQSIKQWAQWVLAWESMVYTHQSMMAVHVQRMLLKTKHPISISHMY